LSLLANNFSRCLEGLSASLLLVLFAKTVQNFVNDWLVN
jgi:hypothetical protein